MTYIGIDAFRRAVSSGDGVFRMDKDGESVKQLGRLRSRFVKVSVAENLAGRKSLPEAISSEERWRVSHNAIAAVRERLGLGGMVPEAETYKSLNAREVR